MSKIFFPHENTAEKSSFPSVRTFVLRMGRMTSKQKHDYAQFSEKWCLPFAKESLNFSGVFGKKSSVTIEIGFGMGAATATLAEQNPEKAYLGLEVHRPGVGKLLGEIERRSLKNVYIVEHDALEVLEWMIPDNSVDAFHLFFPDPWPKKKHHKRRLIRRPRTDLLTKKLRSEGYLYMVTDWEPYARQALEELTATAFLSNYYDGFAQPQAWRPETRFEVKGKQASRAIYELFFIKDPSRVQEGVSDA